MVGVRRKKPLGNAPFTSTNKSKRQKGPLDLAWKDDDNLESSSEEENANGNDSDDDGGRRVHEESEEEEEETVDAKRVRMAREYLKKLEHKKVDSSDDEEDENDGDNDNDDDPMSSADRISMRLQKERLAKEGALERNVAHFISRDMEKMCKEFEPKSTPSSEAADAEQQAKSWLDKGYIHSIRGHDLTPTCVAMPLSGEFCLTGSKDNSVLLYDIERAVKTSVVCPTWKSTNMKYRRNDAEVLAMACSDDGKYAAVGKRNATVDIHDLRIAGNSTKSHKSSLITTFKGHKGPVTSLTFRTQSMQLFSASEDRCIRHYNLDEMAYVETLYGHQAAVTDIDCHFKEQPISVGRDRTARAWKLTEDTHLIFRGGSRLYPAECCSQIKDSWLLTGHEAQGTASVTGGGGGGGTLALWMTEKKKAVATLDNAHTAGISSIAALKGSDMACTGSNDGYLRLWRVLTGKTNENRGVESIAKVPVHGFINDIAIGPKARFCVAAVGQEPRLGRWERVPRAKNRLNIIQLRLDSQRNNHGSDDGDDDEDDNDYRSSSERENSEDESSRNDLESQADSDGNSE